MAQSAAPKLVIAAQRDSRPALDCPWLEQGMRGDLAGAEPTSVLDSA